MAMNEGQLRARLADAERALAECDPKYLSEYWAMYLPVTPTSLSQELIRSEAKKHPNVINLKGR
jgi:hypothetical protein